jgi:16S rRNA C967 or C1407 C5-methylase (RsmB/RsmF family)
MSAVAGKAVVLKECATPAYQDYAKKVIENCKALASDLQSEGMRAVSGGTQTHLALIDIRSTGVNGKVADERCGLSGISLNKNSIPFEILYSLPVHLLKIFENQKVNQWEANWKAMQQKAPIFLRLNESQAKMDYFTQILDEYQFEYQQISELDYDNHNIKLSAIELKQPIPKNHEIFAVNGHQFEIQDIGSQCLSILSNPQNDTKILESCAGNGGKTTHLLDLTKSITLHSMDIEPKKLQHLEQRVKRMFGKKVKTFEATAEEISSHKAWADALYLDVPCSGSGTIRRQADLKYRINEAFIQQKVMTQQSIIESFMLTLKENSSIHYSTCSLFTDENEKQIEFIEKQGFKCQSFLKLEPCKYNGDGFFWAHFSKK